MSGYINAWIRLVAENGEERVKEIMWEHRAKVKMPPEDTDEIALLEAIQGEEY